MIDPYLTPDAPCWVWGDWEGEDQKEVWHFFGYKRGKPEFYQMQCATYFYFDHYYPVGTEWDFAPPDAVCSTVDADGGIRFWESDNLDQVNDEWIDRECGYQGCQGPSDFICPDKSRFEGKAWETSLRMRPTWARGKNNAVK